MLALRKQKKEKLFFDVIVWIKLFFNSLEMIILALLLRSIFSALQILKRKQPKGAIFPPCSLAATKIVCLAIGTTKNCNLLEIRMVFCSFLNYE